MPNVPTGHLDGPPRRRFRGGPLVRPGRLVGLDLARALALVGMISTHLLPSIVDHRATLSHQLAGGPSSALFALLAGVSLALVTGRQHPLHGRARFVASVGLFVRALLIYAFGLWLAHRPTDIAVILPHYGILFVLALPFLGLKARGAAIAAVIWVVGAPFALRASLGHVPEEGVYGWHTLQQIVFTGTYPATVWLAHLLAGLAIGRLDLRRRITMVWLAVGGGGLAVLAAVTSDRLLLRTPIMDRLVDDIDPRGTAPDLYPVLRQGLYGFVPKGSWWWLATHTAHSGTPFDLARTIGTSLLVIGLCLLVAEVVPRTVAGGGWRRGHDPLAVLPPRPHEVRRDLARRRTGQLQDPRGRGGGPRRRLPGGGSQGADGGGGGLGVAPGVEPHQTGPGPRPRRAEPGTGPRSERGTGPRRVPSTV